ncbi:MAG: IS66 family insertion sequence element accessory protein TnpB [Eubacteriales bacterium]|jgi:transposase|nr:IS66 family insertion sequence element accessory protein TnpB [Eubacteriales bacterium]
MFTEKGITFSKIIIAVGRSNLRYGIDGLCAMIRLKYDLDPLQKDTLFLFCGTRSDRIKGILWTGDRFVMIYIRLADGYFQWPRTEEEARTLSGEEFLRLMDGFSIDPSVGKKRKAPPKEDPKKKRHY